MAPFTYDNTGYAIVALGTIALYGWLLERRHGPVLVLVLFALAGVGGRAVTADRLHAAVGPGRQRRGAGLHGGLGDAGLLSLRGGDARSRATCSARP